MENNQNSSGSDNQRPMLTGMFADRESTEQAYNALHERGYSKDDINLLMSDETKKKHYSKNEEDAAFLENSRKSNRGQDL